MLGEDLQKSVLINIMNKKSEVCSHLYIVNWFCGTFNTLFSCRDIDISSVRIELICDQIAVRYHIRSR